MPNRAAELLQRIEHHATERAQWAALGIFFAGGPAALFAVLAGWAGLLLGVLFTAAVTLRALLLIRRAVACAIGEATALHAIVGRVVTFEVREWHIVGAE